MQTRGITIKTINPSTSRSSYSALQLPLYSFGLAPIQPLLVSLKLITQCELALANAFTGLL